jgi:hypothetical protein
MEVRVSVWSTRSRSSLQRKEEDGARTEQGRKRGGREGDRRKSVGKSDRRRRIMTVEKVENGRKQDGEQDDKSELSRAAGDESKSDQLDGDWRGRSRSA